MIMMVLIIAIMEDEEGLEEVCVDVGGKGIEVLLWRCSGEMFCHMMIGAY